MKIFQDHGSELEMVLACRVEALDFVLLRRRIGQSINYTGPVERNRANSSLHRMRTNYRVFVCFGTVTLLKS